MRAKISTQAYFKLVSQVSFFPSDPSYAKTEIDAFLYNLGIGVDNQSPLFSHSRIPNLSTSAVEVLSRLYKVHGVIKKDTSISCHSILYGARIEPSIPEVFDDLAKLGFIEKQNSRYTLKVLDPSLSLSSESPISEMSSGLASIDASAVNESRPDLIQDLVSENKTLKDEMVEIKKNWSQFQHGMDEMVLQLNDNFKKIKHFIIDTTAELNALRQENTALKHSQDQLKKRKFASLTTTVKKLSATVASIESDQIVIASIHKALVSKVETDENKAEPIGPLSSKELGPLSDIGSPQLEPSLSIKPAGLEGFNLDVNSFFSPYRLIKSHSNDSFELGLTASSGTESENQLKLN